MAHKRVNYSNYLHNAFVAQSEFSDRNIWIADSGASCHMTHDYLNVYDVDRTRPPQPGRECVVSVDRIFHGNTQVRHTLFIACNSANPRRHVISDATGTDI